MTPVAADRRLAYLRRLSATAWGEPRGFLGPAPFRALPALALATRGEAAPPVPWDHVAASLALLHERRDCQDFAMAGLLPLLLRFGETTACPPTHRQAIADALLAAKYAELDPGADHCCWHTENHQVLYASAEYLAGHHFADQPFAVTGRPGCWHRERAREQLYRWLDWRTRFGFSEWLSSCYFDEDAAALLNLVEFAPDARLRHRAEVVLTLLLTHVASHSWRGLTAHTQGRAYQAQQWHPEATAMAALGALAWGECEPPAELHLAAVLLALSRYQVPPLVAAIARATPPELIVREHHSLDPAAAPRYGVFPDRQRDLDFFRGAALVHHPTVVETEYAWRGGQAKWPGYFAARDYYRRRQTAGEPYDGEALPYAMSGANVYTCRRPEGVLSCAQAYRPGCPGYQQYIWCAALGPGAVVYTTNPAPPDVPYGRPGPWVGHGVLPQAQQHRHVLVCLHCVRPVPIYDQPPWFREDRVHAYFPRAAFDEVVEANGWTCARRGDGYLALRATVPLAWRGDHELNADATDVAFVLEMGAARTAGSFAAFVAAQAAAPLTGGIGDLRYGSPTLGEVRAAWGQPLTVAGVAQPATDYPRFAAPWGQAEVGATAYHFHYAGHHLHLDAEAAP